MELTGRVALVTGGGSGMGRASARRLAAEGMKVCVVDLDGGTAREVAEEIGGIAIQASVADREQLDAAFDECVARLGGLDLAHLNAGIGILAQDIATIDMADYRRITGVNLDGVVFGTAAALRAMRSRPDGRTGGAIIVTNSLGGIMPEESAPFYCLTKYAVVGYIRSITPTLAREGISTHLLCPGLTDTNFLPPEMREMFVSLNLTMINPDEIAEAVVKVAHAPIELSGSTWACFAGKEATIYEPGPVPGFESPFDAIRES
jgi:NAD(P)-dependent dehydrogenase (short-subunit alcohol dehydrogenase family)